MNMSSSCANTVTAAAAAHTQEQLQADVPAQEQLSSCTNTGTAAPTLEQLQQCQNTI
jgi:hypothetical protein